jgi:hypothetical protein
MSSRRIAAVSAPRNPSRAIKTSTARSRIPSTAAVSEDLLLLADAQTAGGLTVAGEVPGAPVIGELVPRGPAVLVLR